MKDLKLNHDIADKLHEIARLLEEQNANPYRVLAYRRAAATLEAMHDPIEQLVETKGYAGLLDLPGIGEGIGRSIYEYIAMGRMSRLETLRAGQDPIELFEKIPGVGPSLANKIYSVLHIDTLEALELAAHNGRLANIPGLGKGRVETIQAWLAKVLGKRRQPELANRAIDEPPVDVLLKIDQRYRQRAEADSLPKIAPKRFNPKGEAWLPIMHSSSGEWHFTALYSNTQRAHALGRTHDWVVIYFYDKHHHEGQHTIVTETRGTLIGKRVVRGREPECMQYYEIKKAI